MTNNNDVGWINRNEPAPSHQDESIRSVFATPDLLVNILRPLIDGDFLPTLSSLSLVSKNFHQATLSNQVWREMCYRRWKGKWGFYPRWEKGLIDYSDSLTEKQRQAQLEHIAAGNFWKSRYFFEEQDATRQLILSEELESLVFDFRFWMGQPTIAGGFIVLKSGLLTSASREVRFSRPPQGDGGMLSENNEDIFGTTWSARGHLTGHPCKEPGIEWFLDELAGTLQWGFMPNLWPQGSIERLDNWGWQIQNPNVVLRSIDALPPLPMTSKLGVWDETILDEIERECSKNHGQICKNYTLWKDLIDTLENVPLKAAPLVNGFKVTADIPRAFSEQYE